MKATIYLLSIIFLLTSCKIKDSEDNWAKIKQTNSIEEYQNYLIEYPHTKHLSKITDSLSIFWKKYYFENGDYDCHTNCLILMINKNGQILFNGEFIDKKDLKEKIIYAIENPDNLPNLPSTKDITIEKLGVFSASRGIIDIATNNEITDKNYSEIIQIVKESFIEIQNKLSMQLYNKNINKINSEQKSIVQKIVPIKIQFERYFPVPTEVLPLPPTDSIIIE